MGFSGQVRPLKGTQKDWLRRAFPAIGRLGLQAPPPTVSGSVWTGRYEGPSNVHRLGMQRCFQQVSIGYAILD